MGHDETFNVAIVGGGPGCKAIMDMIFAEKLRELRMKLIGVACTNPEAVGYRYAMEKGIYTTADYRDLYKLKELNMLIELTGRDEVANEISRTRPDHVRLMDHVGARVFWDLFRVEEERFAERKRAEKDINNTVNRMQIAYEESIIYARELNQEIGERERAEKALAAESDRLRVTLRSIGDGVITTDTKGRIVLINRVAEELTGWSEEEAIGKALADVFHIVNGKTRRPCENPMQKVIETGEVVGFVNHAVLIARDGTERILADSAAPIRDKKGKIIGVVLVFRDITEKRKLEARFQQIEKMEALGNLAAGIAHDFNNLLMGIQGATSLILMDIDPNHPYFQYLNAIEDMVKSGARLTRQLLGFAGGGKSEIRPTDLNELVRNSSKMFGRAKKEIRIHRKYQKDLWTVEVDRAQIERVLLNLYVNAWQAMSASADGSAGGPWGGDLYLRTENVTLDKDYVKPFGVEAGHYVKISVRDTGVGIDEETQQRILEPFFTTKEMGRGTGLGLASTYGIIKDHDGIVDFYSQKEQGTTFNIYLPAAKAVASGQEG